MTEAHAVHVPPGGWTVDDLDSWPETLRRFELTDGALTISASPSGLHQAVAVLLSARLDAVAPPDLAALPAVEIRFGPRLTRRPDLVVVRSPHPTRHWYAPAEVLLAVEVESPGSHTEDRVTRPALHARHGILHYWRLEVGPLRARVHRLADGDVYRETSGGEERLVAAEPFPVDLALTDLLPGWAR